MSEFGPGWTSQLGDATPAPSPVSIPTPAAYELRPLSTGEILDRTFTLYRRNFWLYAGLSAMAAAVAAILQIAQYAMRGFLEPANQATPGHVNFQPLLISLAVIMVVSLFFLAAYSVTQAATMAAVSSIYLGHETSIGGSLRKIRGAWFRYILISLWQDWSGFWPMVLIYAVAFGLILTRNTALVVLGGLTFLLILPALPYGIIAYIRNSMAIPASVVEDFKVRKSMRRSKTLAAETKGRIFLLFLLLFVLKLVAGGIQMPIAFFLIKSHAGERLAAEGLATILAFVTTTLIGPIGAIGLSLFYFDQRVRKEGFDIEALMDRSLGAGGAAIVSETPATAAFESPFTSQLPGSSSHTDAV